ncbi:LOW QUALITY PROTEIN: Hypothetical protein PHPALM_17384 [Phytophthora palmivora]|uniref:Uncharacterized protein n=1 Tax=Phytophthora palmivora TaxID=4796 RepID=A0A2P4XMC8_9STRA|nr:LOW QUALITY PROTEIN: Hypothetical protein PHPALM_17384 [Phytophthora palmivora]
MWANYVGGKVFPDCWEYHDKSDWFIKLLLSSIVAKHLSDDMLAKVRCQWDYYMVYLSDTTCIKRRDVAEWEVTTRGYTYHCKDLKWSYTCLFYRSFNLASPDVSWNVFTVLKTFARPIFPTLGYDGNMRRREKANVVVLSSEEKYCFAKAMFEPVMAHLTGLSSPDFYASLKSWKEIVKKGMQGTLHICRTQRRILTKMPRKHQRTLMMTPTAAMHPLGPDEMYDTIKMIQDMEQKASLDILESVVRLKYCNFPDKNNGATRGKE